MKLVIQLIVIEAPVRSWQMAMVLRYGSLG